MSRHPILEQEHHEAETDHGRIRVLLLIKGLGRGGAEQLLVNAVEYGDSARFDYRVAYLLPWKNAFVGELRALGIPVTCLDGGSGFGWIRRLRRLLREERIDLIHVHSPYVAALVRATMGRRRPVLVTTEHNVWDRYHRGTYWVNAATFPRNDHVFAVSDEVRDSIRFPAPLRFLKRPPLETLHHGIDVSRVASVVADESVRRELGIPGEVPVVGTVANFKPHKGHAELLRVAERVARNRPEVRFVMVGGGPNREQVAREAERLGLGDVVVMPGFREDALRIMRAFDVYALPSMHEGLSLTLLEAMAIGCPAVATRVGGVSAVIQDGINGYIVEPSAPDEQADRILALLADEPLRRRFGEAARVRAASFDVRRAVQRIERVYMERVS